MKDELWKVNFDENCFVRDSDGPVLDFGRPFGRPYLVGPTTYGRA